MHLVHCMTAQIMTAITQVALKAGSIIVPGSDQDEQAVCVCDFIATAAAEFL